MEAEPRASYQTAFQRANFIRRDWACPCPQRTGGQGQAQSLRNPSFEWRLVSAPSARLEPSLILEREIDYPKWTRRVYANRTRNRATGKNRLFTASSERGDKSSRFPNLCRKPTPPQRMSFLLF